MKVLVTMTNTELDVIKLTYRAESDVEVFEGVGTRFHQFRKHGGVPHFVCGQPDFSEAETVRQVQQSACGTGYPLTQRQPKASS